MYNYFYDANTGVIQGVFQGLGGLEMKDCAKLQSPRLYDPETHRVDLSTMQIVSTGEPSELSANPRRSPRA